MRFSILVPAYNSEKTVCACLDSVLQQTYGDFELVVVDDGATDGTAAILDGYAAAHPEVVRVLHQKNTGLIGARRAGIAAARGDFCLFLDADDALEPETLETIAATVDETGADMVIFNYRDVYASGTTHVADPVFVDGSTFSGSEKETLYAELIRGWRLNNLCTKAIATPLVQADDTDYGPYLDNPNAEDLLQTLYPITHANVVVYRALPLYRYCRRADSISSLALAGQIERQCNDLVMAKLRDYMTVWGMETPAWLRAYHTRRLHNLVSLFWQHYRAAGTRGERRAVLLFDWNGRLTDEDRLYLADNGLGRAKKMQLSAILNKRTWLLDAFLFVGNLKMKVRHGA